MARADRGASSWDELDESDVRVRANKKGSRPRTKERPAYEAVSYTHLTLPTICSV